MGDFDAIISAITAAAERGDLGGADIQECIADALTVAGIACEAYAEMGDSWPRFIVDVLTEGDVAIVVYEKKPSRRKIAFLLHRYFRRVSGGVLLAVPGAHFTPNYIDGFDGPCAIMGL